MNRKEQFEALFERYQRAVQIFFRKRGLSGEDALDLAQETFLEIYKSLPRFDEEYPRAWVLAVAKNRWFKLLRSNSAQKRSAELVPIDDLDSGEIKILAQDDGEQNALKRLLQAEKKEWLRRELNALPPQMRQCLRLRVDQGMKYREIAAVLQINVQTVKSHLSQAKTRLQESLAEAPRTDEGGHHG